MQITCQHNFMGHNYGLAQIKLYKYGLSFA